MSTLQIDRQIISVGGIILILLGLVLSRAVMSIGMFIITANAILNPNLFRILRTWLRSPVNIALATLFLLYLVSGLWSEDQAYWADRVRIKLPLLFLPLGFTAMKPLSKKQLSFVLRFFVYLITLAALGSLIAYLTDFKEITDNYTRGQILPTPHNSHVRFSLILAFAFFCGLHLIENEPGRSKFERVLLGLCCLFIFFFLHVLAVRSGLLASYLGIAYSFSLFIFRTQSFGKGILLFSSTLVIITCLFFFLPSLKQKVKYVKYDLEMYLKGEVKKDHSDSERLASVKTGFKLALAHPFTGVGAGDVLTQMNSQLKKDYPHLAGQRLLPHNQFIYTFLACGIGGLLLLIAIVVLPMLSENLRSVPLFINFMIIQLVSFSFEHPLEVQLGTAFFLLFFLLLIKQFYPGKINIEESINS